MIGALVGLAGGLALVALVTVAVVVVGLRRGSPRVRRAISRLNRATLNRRQLSIAGRAGARMSLLEHRGRRTGTVYLTPVGATRTEDGFIVALPYGAGTDWVRNVLAAGTACLRFDGAIHEVVAPRRVPVHEVLDHFGPADRRLLAFVGVREVLRLTDFAPTMPA